MFVKCERVNVIRSEIRLLISIHFRNYCRHDGLTGLKTGITSYSSLHASINPPIHYFCSFGKCPLLFISVRNLLPSFHWQQEACKPGWGWSTPGWSWGTTGGRDGPVNITWLVNSNSVLLTVENKTKISIFKRRKQQQFIGISRYLLAASDMSSISSRSRAKRHG